MEPCFAEVGDDDARVGYLVGAFARPDGVDEVGGEVGAGWCAVFSHDGLFRWLAVFLVVFFG